MEQMIIDSIGIALIVFTGYCFYKAFRIQLEINKMEQVYDNDIP